jgi:excisionase family DNA binding protein
MVDEMHDPYTSGEAKKEWLIAGEAAGYLRIKRQTLLLWVRQGKVPAYALSGNKRKRWRFRKADLDAMLIG